MLLMIVYRPELVHLETDGQEIIHIILPKHYVQLLRKMLEEEEDEEGTRLMTSRAHLHHLVEKIRRLAATNAVHGVELFHTLKIRQLVRRRMPLLDLCVWQVLRRVHDEVQDHPEGLLGQGIDDQGLRHSKPSLTILRPERRKEERAMVLIIVVHSRGSPNVGV
jgi:hypothetical protein